MAKVSPIGRVSYPSVFEPSAYGDEEAKYDLTLVFEDGDDLSEIEEAIDEAIAKKWNGKRPKDLLSPIKTDPEKYDGRRYARFTAKKNRPPQVVDQAKQEIDEDSGRFYPGCFARVSFNSYAWAYMGRSGVSLGLGNVQKTDEGEPFDGRSTAEDDFDAVNSDEFI